MNPKQRTYKTPQAFRTALTARLKAAAKVRDRHYAQIEREFLLQRFLARVFAHNSTEWVLKGGTALLIRIPDARYSRDIDLLNTHATVDEAIDDLRTEGRCSKPAGTTKLLMPLRHRPSIAGIHPDLPSRRFSQRTAKTSVRQRNRLA